MATLDQLVADAADAHGVTIVGQLQDGGQKSVRKVERAGDQLVLKVIELSGSTPDELRRAEREVELLGKIDSPHVVKVQSELLQLGEPIEGACWLEEFVDGDDLRSLSHGGWEWPDVAKMMRDVALGLGEAHRLKVVHRDLSTGNVRRRSDGSWVVLDFGFARHTLRSGLTVFGHPGTRGFLTPEHLQGFSGGPNPASDVFGVGILAYFVLSGQLPVQASDDEDYLTRLLKCQIRPIGELRPDLEPDRAAVVMRCLHPQNARRYLNGNRLAQALEALA